MSFALSGTTITQSGTDTDLSGLSGIAGVTTEISTGTVTHTTNWLGGTVIMNSPLQVESGSVFNAEAGVLYNSHNSFNQIRLENVNATDDSNFNLSGVLYS